MDIEKIIAELRNEVKTINEAIAALQRLVPNGADERSGARSIRPPAKKEE